MYMVYISRQMPEKSKRREGGNQTKERVIGRQGKQRVGRKRRDKPQEVVVSEKKWWKLLVLFRAEVTCNRGESCKHPLFLRWTMD